jgi:putative transposase
MGDFVVMPNHVHLLAAFASAESLREQCDSWLHFTAFQINRAIGERGKFWHQEPFDHLVRSPEQYEYLREYIAENPIKARLRAGEFYYRRYGGR